MILYIKIKNGQPFEHPILVANFCEAYPDVDLNNLPDWVVPFERVTQPIIGAYEKNQRVVYEIKNNVCTDVWLVEQMTADEKIVKQDEVKSDWLKRFGYASWTFNEETCRFDPPIPYPNDGKFYSWSERDALWVENAA